MLNNLQLTTNNACIIPEKVTTPTLNCIHISVNEFLNKENKINYHISKYRVLSFPKENVTLEI